MSSSLPVSTSDHPNACNSATPVPLQICIASTEFIGTCDQGNTGFAYTATAQALALAGHHVTCLFLGERLPSTHEWQRWVEKYRADGLTLIALPPINASELVAPPNLIKSYEAYQWLKRNDRFDIVHFPEREGPGYHTLTAKHHGLAFTKATICVGLHNLASWMQSPEEKPVSAVAEVDTGFMERRALALADAVVSPAHNLAKWISERPRTTPAQESAKQPPVQAKPALIKGINEFVYFGTLEARQGLDLFCDALDRLPLAAAKKIQAVTFLGQESIICGIPSHNYLQKRAHRWAFPIQIIDRAREIETMNYLREKNRLTVIPALRDGSPYRVLECLVAKVAFVASRVGGITELIATEDLSKVCFEPDACTLSTMLATVLSDGISPARAGVEVENAQEVSPGLAINSPEATDRSDDLAQAAIQALSIDPDDSVALKVLARIHLNAGLVESAEEACQLVLKRNANDAEALQMLGEARNPQLAGSNKTSSATGEQPFSKEKRRHESRPLLAADFTTPFAYS